MIQVKIVRREYGFAAAICKRRNAQQIVDQVFVAENIRYHRNRLNFKDSSSYCCKYLPISRA
jgi:hypothetical protein